MKKKKSGLTILVFILVILFLVVVAAAGVIYLGNNKIKELEAQVEDLEWEIEDNTRLVYVAADNLTKGTKLEKDVNVFLQENVTALPGELYISESDLGKTLICNVSAFEPIMASMVTEEAVTADLREVEIGIANLMLDQKVNDYIDIRIMFPTGEDFVVIPKVRIKSLVLEDAIFYANLNESEILTLASATIDAYTITGTKIYVTRYVESNLQEEAVANYPVRPDTLSLIASDPNILEVAKETLNYNARALMEQRLLGLSEEVLKSISTGHGIVDTAHASAFTTIQNEQKNDLYTEE